MQPLTPGDEIALAQRREYCERGFLRESFALGDPSPLPQLCRDVALFDAKLAEWQASGHSGIPYLFTEAIEHVARDAAIRAVVEALLGTDAWVVWEPAILSETPNAASRWHVDLDSRYWPSISIAVGVSGCSAKTVLSYLPGTHRLERTPFSCGDDADTDRVLRSARRTNHSSFSMMRPRRSHWGVGSLDSSSASRCRHHHPKVRTPTSGRRTSASPNSNSRCAGAPSPSASSSPRRAPSSRRRMSRPGSTGSGSSGSTRARTPSSSARRWPPF